MKNVMHHLALGFMFLSCAALAGAAESSPKPAATPPVTLLENDYVRVQEFRSQPGEKSPMHSHPGQFLVYAFTKVSGRMTTADGKVTEEKLKKGSVTWNEPVKHEVENTGAKEAHVMVVDLKKEVGSKAPKGEDPVKLDPTSYKVLLENDRVRVLEARVKPGTEIGMHAHPAAVLYAFNAFKVQFTTGDGAKQEVEQEAGKARWLEPVLHSHKQLGDKTAHVLLVELKK